MKKITSLFAMLFMAFSNSLWSAEVDTVWVSDFKSEIRFQHPVTKNLVLEQFGKLIELDSKTGEFIRELPINTDWLNPPLISTDGIKLLHTNSNHTYIYEYPSLQLIYQLDSCLFSKFINNDEVVGRNFYNSNLVKYNIKTKEKQIFNVQGSVENIATSPDGRFIAYSLSSTDDIKSWSKLILMDAKTMKDITILNEVTFSDFQFSYANFSSDGKYITFWGSDEKNQYGQIFFNTTTLKIEKNRIPIADSLKGYINILSKDLLALKINTYDQINFKDIYKTQIIDFKSDKILLTINNTYGCIFNEELNHLYYLDIKNKKTVCLNITNLITGITPFQLNTIVKYQNKQLTINNENVRKVEISDISGRLIMSKVIENPFSINTILPLNLANGSYLINIITDKESFTHKLLVME
jgi:hypothetical protein